MALLNQQHYPSVSREEQQTLFQEHRKKGQLSSGTVRWEQQGDKQAAPKTNLSQLVTGSGHICHWLFDLEQLSGEGGQNVQGPVCLGTAGTGVGIWQEERGSSTAGLSWQLSGEEAGSEGSPATAVLLFALCSQPEPLVLPELQHPILGTACE